MKGKWQEVSVKWEIGNREWEGLCGIIGRSNPCKAVSTKMLFWNLNKEP